MNRGGAGGNRLGDRADRIFVGDLHGSGQQPAGNRFDRLPVEWAISGETELDRSQSGGLGTCWPLCAAGVRRSVRRSLVRRSTEISLQVFRSAADRADGSAVGGWACWWPSAACVRRDDSPNAGAFVAARRRAITGREVVAWQSRKRRGIQAADCPSSPDGVDGLAGELAFVSAMLFAATAKLLGHAASASLLFVMAGGECRIPFLQHALALAGARGFSWGIRAA